MKLTYENLCKLKYVKKSGLLYRVSPSGKYAGGYRIAESCRNCGDEFLSYQGREEFCTQSCAKHGKFHNMFGKKRPEVTRRKISASRNGKYSGEKHYRWNGGITPLNVQIRNSIEGRCWRREVFYRDNYTCQLCNRRGGDLHAHHIAPFAEFPEFRFDRDNGLTVCVKCHKEVHEIYREAA